MRKWRIEDSEELYNIKDGVSTILASMKKDTLMCRHEKTGFAST